MSGTDFASDTPALPARACDTDFASCAPGAGVSGTDFASCAPGAGVSGTDFASGAPGGDEVIIAGEVVLKHHKEEGDYYETQETTQPTDSAAAA